MDLLTNKEREVTRYISEGYSLEEIADIRHRSLCTVKAQVGHAKEKLGARSLAHLVRIAIEQHIIEV